MAYNIYFVSVADDPFDLFQDYNFLDSDDYARPKITQYKYDSDDRISMPNKRFWNRLWPMYRSHRITWTPVHKKLDQYRFLMKGLGKRGDEIPSLQAVDQQRRTEDDVLKDKTLSKGDENEQSIGTVKDFVMLTKAYADILDSLDKRTPEVYSQKLYPIQDGTQRMEVEMDRKLDSLMEDDAIQNSNEYADNVMNIHKQDLDDIGHLVSQGRDNGLQLSNGYIANDAMLPLQEVKRDEINQKQKRWWAATRLKLFGLKTPKSMRERHYRRARIDPVLYLIGLGR